MKRFPAQHLWRAVVTVLWIAVLPIATAYHGIATEIPTTTAPAAARLPPVSATPIALPRSQTPLSTSDTASLSPAPPHVATQPATPLPISVPTAAIARAFDTPPAPTPLPSPSATATLTHALPATVTQPTSTLPPLVGLPVRVRIPAIGTDAVVEQIGVTPGGAMDAPQAFDDTAWYDRGARPGDEGVAVIDGHVDSKTGPAVFWDLRKLKAGNEILVIGDDGLDRRFVVRHVASYKRTEAPLDQIFGPLPGRHLNLMTSRRMIHDPRHRRAVTLAE